MKANPALKDKALEDALQQQPWDPSVKSLAVFPQVLTMMSEKIDWTQKLGDAFLAQQKDVMATAQALRAKAQQQGALKDSKEQKVTTADREQHDVHQDRADESRSRLRADVQPDGRLRRVAVSGLSAVLLLSAGLRRGRRAARLHCRRHRRRRAVGQTATGARGDVNVNVNRYNNFNRTNISNGNWNHNAHHRGAVPYRDKGVAQQYGRGQAANAASRDAFRGRADAGQQSIQRGDVSSRDVPGGGRDSAANRSMSSGRDGGMNSAASRDMSSGRGGSGFDSGRRGASAIRQRPRRRADPRHSNRGSSSMNSARSSGNMGGGGGARGGGGGGGRGGGGGGRGGGGGAEMRASLRNAHGDHDED